MRMLHLCDLFSRSVEIACPLLSVCEICMVSAISLCLFLMYKSLRPISWMSACRDDKASCSSSFRSLRICASVGEAPSGESRRVVISSVSELFGPTSSSCSLASRGLCTTAVL
ncbi:hypothetical protein GDO86_020175 [Hymenochirus boettgeri]|uniref:Uncharacterized protein n=1 Tax=Hymenochirus boettgeri TaxID=247094 RepID=A0A8T2IC15_9PIPI|nr:hypothetical protein GDO86_020175 [Hymenochirus boettgeri]